MQLACQPLQSARTGDEFLLTVKYPREKPNDLRPLQPCVGALAGLLLHLLAAKIGPPVYCGTMATARLSRFCANCVLMLTRKGKSMTSLGIIAGQKKHQAALRLWLPLFLGTNCILPALGSTASMDQASTLRKKNVTSDEAGLADAGEPGAEVSSNKTINVEVLYCSDGDTCRVKIEGSMWVNVRLAGIDAPEVPHGKKKPGQPLGQEAKDLLNNTVKGKSLKLRQTDLDHYNRPVVELINADNSVLNVQMVREGYAEAYRGPAKRLDRAPYLAAEEAARKDKKGVWGQANYQSPADYRKALKD